MIIVLLGAPGAGKGSVGKPLSEHLALPIISTGDIFRANLSGKTELGLKAKSYMEQGQLVPDDLTFSIVKDRLMQEDCEDGFILDGFPRTLNQARLLEEFLSEHGIKLDLVLNIHLEDDVIIRRLTSRMVCFSCGAPYNSISKKPLVDGVCDICGGPVAVRSDDRPEIIMSRLETYREQTSPLIDYYQEKGLLKTMDNDCTIEEGAERALALIEDLDDRHDYL